MSGGSMPKKRVWILGAGASKGMGYPLGIEVLDVLDQEFFGFMHEIMDEPRLTELERQFNDARDNATRRGIETSIEGYVQERTTAHRDGPLLLYSWGMRRVLTNVCEKFFGHRRLENIDFENLFTQIRLLQEGYFQELFAEEIGRHRNYSVQSEENLMCLLHWLSMRLDARTDYESVEARIYRRFADHLDPVRDVVISFNPDHLLERCLGLENRGVFYPPPDARDAHLDDRVTIIKPHGSFNWVYVRQSDLPQIVDSLRLFSIDPEAPAEVHVAMELSRETVNGAERPRLCCIMAPDGFKGIVRYPAIDGMFRDYYDQALTELQAADQVTIVGFAVRPTDALAGTLLNMGLRGKRKGQVIVVDPSDQVPEGISRNVSEFTYSRKTFHQWIIDEKLSAAEGV